MKTFDDILKKCKEDAVEPSSKYSGWRDHINNVVNSLNALQEFYSNPDIESVQVDSIRCRACDNKSFTLTVVDLDDEAKSWRYKTPSWTTVSSADFNTFICDKCNP